MMPGDQDITEFPHDEELARVTRERDALKDWKESALLVESRWSCQNVAKLLGITLGQDIRPNIEPKIRELLLDRARLEACLNHTGGLGIFLADGTTVPTVRRTREEIDAVLTSPPL